MDDDQINLIVESPEEKAERIANIRKDYRIYSFDKALRLT